MEQSRKLDVRATTGDVDEQPPRLGADDSDALRLLQAYWDEDAATYDSWAEHGANSPRERAAWTATLRRLLPPRGRVLDVGAGTGFLSLTAARMGYEVTALDISTGMLSCLEQAARKEALKIEIVHSPADEPPAGPFDAVIERLAIWTLPDPAKALHAWRAVAPGGRLVLFEGLWSGHDYIERSRARGRRVLNRLRRRPEEHHAPYDSTLMTLLPLLANPSPDRIIELVSGAGWQQPRLERLRDVEWARSLNMSPLERMLGVTPEFAVSAD
jgi:SAM-dependent methyltransferase